jgi:RNA ligase (TIGR02306 family)
MSSLIVPVTTIEKITSHDNADTLELAQVLGWQVVVRKGEYQVGDRITYFPVDTVLPLEWSERFGVTRHLSKGRIRCAKLRGEPSFGLVVKPEDENWEIGQNVADYYGVSRWEPPLRAVPGDSEPDHPLFWSYTEIENMRNFPTILTASENVVLSEKVHGTQCRLGMIEGELMAGSKSLRRKRPEGDAFASNIYWFPFSLEPVRAFMEDLGRSHRQVMLFGEVYGSKIQSFHYGCKGTFGFRAFDLLIDGNYLDWQQFVDLCEAHGVATVPIVAAVPFSLAEVKRYSEGKTLLLNDQPHIREGVVVKPLHERNDPKLGRVILKYVSDTYLFGEKTDYTDQ